MARKAREPIPGRIRVEVTDQHGTAVEITDPARLGLTPRQRDQLAGLADGLMRDLVAVLGHGEDHARQVAVACLVRLLADAAAYEREAARRGLLPL